jgi:hypothetical protein
MVVVAQLVRALDCGSRGRRFETGLPPNKTLREIEGFSYFFNGYFQVYLSTIQLFIEDNSAQ